MGPKGEPKKPKEKPLNDIKNKPEMRPVILKPERDGLRQGVNKHYGEKERDPERAQGEQANAY